ncbi:MAG: hypothetical protein EBR79_03845, partial [Proteobacteria bacterium]|nr:hypothetical protein [Pseudomonadota bacterium]
SPHRLILVQGISGAEAATTLAALTEAVKSTLSFPLQGVTIVIPVPHALDKTSPLVKAAETHAQALSVRFFVEAGANLSQWLQTELKALGQSIEPDALQLLTEGLGADKELARRELEKLDETPITTTHVLASLAGSTPADAFRLAEAVGQRNPQKADALLQNLLGQGEDLSAAFTLTLRHLALLKQAQTLKAQGQPDAEILKLTGKLRAPKPVQNDFLNQAKRYPPQRLQTLPEYAIETLTHARSGLLESNFVLHRALLALSA